MFDLLVSLQGQIYEIIGDRLGAFAQQPDGWLFLSILPFGIVFGAIHALTPGHSKTILAAYVFGRRVNYAKSLMTSVILSATHVSVSVFIVLFSLPLVSRFIGTAGRAPLLEAISRGLLVSTGLWMIWTAIRSGTRQSACSSVD